jgi:fluoride exporter
MMDSHGLAIFIGGGIGALLRASLSQVSGIGSGPLSGIPLGTLWANWGGSFLLGVLVGAMISHHPLRSGLTTGLMGGLTTFSTLTIENINIFNEKGGLAALFHFGLHGVGGLIFAFLGLSIGVTLHRGSI